MTPTTVRFRFYTGLTSNRFAAAALLGSWSGDGFESPDAWSSCPMSPFVG